MCTALVWFDPKSDIPVCVAFNRDELYSRLENTPQLYSGAAARALYPVDTASAGTWFGVNSNGIAGMLLNDNRTSRAGKGSRGIWLANLLKNAVSLENAYSLALSGWQSRFRPSWAVLASFERLVLLRLNSKVAKYELPPGLHILCDSSGFGLAKRGGWLRPKATSRPPPRCFDDVRELLSEHASCARRYYTTCCHAGISGTVSAQFLKLSRDKREARLWYVSGSPCSSTEPQEFILPLDLPASS